MEKVELTRPLSFSAFSSVFHKMSQLAGEIAPLDKSSLPVCRLELNEKAERSRQLRVANKQ